MSAIDNVAERDPDVRGLNSTETVQVPPGPILVEQGLFEVSVKSAALVPDTVTLLMLTAVVPVLEITTD